MNSLSALVLTLSSLGGAPQGELLDFTATWCGPCQSVAPTVERLRRKGYPIRKVDVDKHPELRARYGVDSIPQFVLVIDGRPKKRLIGPQTEATLVGLMAQIPRGEPKEIKGSAETKVATDDRPLFRRGIPLPFLGKSKEITAEDVEILRGQNEDESPEQTQVSSNTITQNPMEASVRLRVNQGGSINFGTGTIIESRPDYTLILSCGHIFRGADSETRIAVDYFEGDDSSTWAGKLIRFDDKSDVGLVAIKANRVFPSIRIASQPESISTRDLVFSVGCGNGELPTRWQMFVKSVDQFVGSSIIECTQAPVSGRSGGGLFNRSGELIGVCMAADRERNSGLYAGLKEIYKLLDASSLSALYRRDDGDRKVAVAQSETNVRTIPVKMTTEPKPNPNHKLTEEEIDAIAAALQSSSQSGITICIENSADQQQGYQILISNRAELPERTVTKVVVPEATSDQKAGSSRESFSSRDLQSGETLKWENLMEKPEEPVQGALANRELPAWAR